VGRDNGAAAPAAAASRRLTRPVRANGAGRRPLGDAPTLVRVEPDRTPIDAVAPLRISFVGGGTDLPHWYEEHGGAVLSATIDHSVRVRLVPREDREITVRSLDLGHMVAYHLDQGPAYDGVMDLPKAAIARMGITTGVDLRIESDAPPGSGLGGSSALVTAVVAALAMLTDRRLSAHEVARLSHRIEREDLGISGGWQDQYAAAFGGFNFLEFSRADVSVSTVRASEQTLAALSQQLLLCYTGSVRRNVGLIDRQIRLHREGREETILGMKRLQEMAFAMRHAVERGDVEALGSLLDEAFLAKKQMNPYITEHTQIEQMLGTARTAGAIGGKICGAGGGGYLLLAAPPSAHGAIRAALERSGGQFAAFAFSPDGVRARRGRDVWAPSA
jgi:D-glycero-alpha-D-manno-heptose-7-phosphate kinase